MTVQPFTFPFFQDLAPTTFSRTAPAPATYANGTAFVTVEYSGSGDVVDQPVVPTRDAQIPPGPTASSSNSGCEATDFPAETAGSVALVQRGTCDFAVKARNAEAAGAVAVIIFNEGQEGRTEVLNGSPSVPGIGIPVVGTTFAVGARVSISASTLPENRRTSNVLAETRTGRSDRVAFAGAHLDSVPEGPGINDNGSGSATILEIAEETSELGLTPRNKIRFAYLGSGRVRAARRGALRKRPERQGADGHRRLPQLQHGRIAELRTLHLRRRRLGDPGRRIERLSRGREGLRGLLRLPGPRHPAHGLRRALRPRSVHRGRYPRRGLFTGAEDVKTEEEARLFGGTPGVAFDPCCHSPCDDISNLSAQALDQMSDASAHAILTFARTTSAVNGTEKGQGTPSSSFEYKGSHLRQ